MDQMLIYETGRSDYRKISDIDLCMDIDKNILPKYKSHSIYQLSHNKKKQIAEQLYRAYRLPESQIRRCLAM
jgi:hypothetical protein